MNRLLKAAAAIACALISAPVFAQYTTITASNLKAGNAVIASGKVSVQIRDGNQQPLAVGISGGGLQSSDPIVCQITAGAIVGAVQPDGSVSGTCEIPDEQLSSPNFSADITVSNTASGARSYTLPNVQGITGTAWALDHYSPAALAGAVVNPSPIVFKGAWISTASYSANDVVSYSGSTYVSTTSSNLNHTPTSGSPWTLVWGPLTVSAGAGIHVTASGNNFAVANATQFPFVTPTIFNAYGDSITACIQGQPTASCMYSQVASYYGLTGVNYGYGGDQACDLFTHEVMLHTDYPSLTDGTWRSLMIGTNDADIKGAGTYEATADKCRQALIYWLAVPGQYKLLPTTTPGGATLSAGVTTTGTVTTASSGGYTLCIANTISSGCTYTFTTTQASGPVVVWYYSIDGNAGTGTCTLDSSTSINLTTGTSPAIATQNGGTASLMLARFARVANGSHTLTCLHTNSSGEFDTAGVGFPPAPGTLNYPLALGLIPYQNPAGSSISSPACLTASADATACGAYDQDIIGDWSQAVGDGLDVRLVNPRQWLPANNTYYGDQLHPNAAGQILLAQGFIAAFYAPARFPVPPAPFVSPYPSVFNINSTGWQGQAWQPTYPTAPTVSSACNPNGTVLNSGDGHFSACIAGAWVREW